MNQKYFPYFKDKVCVVTGGTSGIGLEIVKYLLAADAKSVSICARGEKRLKTVCRSLEKQYQGKVFGEIVDVTSRKEIEDYLEKFARQQDRIDIMFNNAGMIQNGKIEAWSFNQWQEIMAVNFWGVVYGTLKVKDIMMENGGGHIVNIASAAGIIPYAYQVAYCSSKFATVGFTRSMRYEFCTRGIKLSTVCPGLVATPMAEEIGRIPEYAIAPDIAVDEIMKGVFNNEDLIVFPKRLETLVHQVNRNEDLLLQNALKRHENMKKQGMSW